MRLAYARTQHSARSHSHSLIKSKPPQYTGLQIPWLIVLNIPVIVDMSYYPSVDSGKARKHNKHAGWGGIPMSPYASPHASPYAIPYTSPHASPYRQQTGIPTPSPLRSQIPSSSPAYYYEPDYSRRPSFGAYPSVPVPNSINPGPLELSPIPEDPGPGYGSQPPEDKNRAMEEPTYEIDEHGLRSTLATDSSDMIIFDLSSPVFGPMRYSQANRDRLEYLPVEELDAVAILPVTTQMDIQCDGLPDLEWLIELRLVNTNRLVGRAPPPITVGDILVMIHQYMAQPVEEGTLSRFSENIQAEIRKAHERRCKLLGAQAAEEKEKGLKRIDVFGGDVWFGGLSSSGFTSKGIKRFKLSVYSGDDRFLF